MNKDIEGKVIVITGASSGMGEAAPKDLVQLGTAVVLGARRTDRIEKLAREIEESGGCQHQKGVLNGIAAVLPHMKKQKSGHIINTSSVVGHKIFNGSAVYSAA